ncbi:MAG: DUF1934 domain-containing protein [Lachnospiraceae bacterium]|nr:DUF1934 domain-containing protein [Lachnospiraceae bacterium]
MTKDVLLAIKGLQFDAAADQTNIQTIMAAEYYLRNNSHYIIYDEATEGSEQSTKNIIKLKGNSMELTKKGFVNVHMLFEENRKNLTNYSTPFGSILIGIDTKKVTLREEEKQILCNVDYALEINYEFLADCKISLEISEREDTGGGLPT